MLLEDVMVEEWVVSFEKDSVLAFSLQAWEQTGDAVVSFAKVCVLVVSS